MDEYDPDDEMERRINREPPYIEPQEAEPIGEVVADIFALVLAKIDANESKANAKPSTNYRAYLESPHWRSLSRWAKWKAGYRCQLCNAYDKPLDAHHRTYERLGRELDGDLIVLCRGCHTLFHEHRKLAR